MSVNGGIFIKDLRKSIDEVILKPEQKLSEVAGREVVVWPVWCNQNQKWISSLSQLSRALLRVMLVGSVVALCVMTFGTIAIMSGLFLKPDATFDDYLSDVMPLFGGFISILGYLRVTAARYGVKLSSSFLVPSTRTAIAYLTSIVLVVVVLVADVIELIPTSN
ncbi:hypothetical protein QYF36_023109 [Acer negundo]|nr:hypothetical protein QYF36_023109 [Acer negundo]